jgi:hypothetical protein
MHNDHRHMQEAQIFVFPKSCDTPRSTTPSFPPASSGDRDRLQQTHVDKQAHDLDLLSASQVEQDTSSVWHQDAS